MKKHLSYISCIFALLFVFTLLFISDNTVYADDPVYGDVATGISYKVKNGGAVIVGTKQSGDIAFPEKVGGYYVTRIGDGESPISGSNITSVSLPVPTVYISDNAFSGHQHLTRITLGSRVREIGNYAFSNCVSLETIYIPPSVTTIKDSAFYNCKSLKTIDLPDEVKEIGAGAFAECTSLESFNIPKGVTKLSSNTFYRCTSIKSFTVPETITEMGSNVFGYCTSLSDFKFNNVITKIPAQTFFHCYGLKSIEIPEHITEIGEWAFGYTGLKSVHIPKNVSQLYGNSFSGSGYIEKLTVDSKNPTLYAANNCIIDKATKTLLAVGKDYKLPHDGSVEIIANSVFLHKSHTEFVIPESIKTISGGAFELAVNRYVYVNSPHIAKQLDSEYACGGVLAGVIEIYVRSDIEEVSQYIKDNYTYTKKVTVNGTSYTYYCNHEHSFYDFWIVGSGAVDMEYHWHECSLCGHQKDLGKHQFDNACDPKCNICLTEFGVADHNFKIANNSTHHWYECSECGEVKDKEEHNLPSSCGGECYDCGYKVKEQHSFRKSADHNAHWMECENCYTVTDCEEHSYSSTWEYNESYHYRSCECGYQSYYQEHVPGAEATETTPQICVTCKMVLHQPLEHVHEAVSTEPIYDKEEHWLVCKCSERMNVEKHVLVTESEEPQIGIEGWELTYCELCGYSSKVIYPPISLPTPTPDPTPNVTDQAPPTASPEPTETQEQFPETDQIINTPPYQTEFIPETETDTDNTDDSLKGSPDYVAISILAVAVLGIGIVSAIIISKRKKR